MIQFPLLGLIILASIIPQRNAIANGLFKSQYVIKRALTVAALLMPLMLFFPKSENTLGEISLAILWTIMWLPIFSKVCNFVIAKRLMIFRRQLGILMGAMAGVHFIQYFFKKKAVSMLKPGFWLDAHGPTYMMVGLSALIIVATLAFTSNDYCMRRLKKNWKQLHKMVYPLIILVLLHVIVYNIGKHLKHPERPFSYTNLYLLTILPACLYFTGKIMEWRRIDLKVVA